MTGTRRFGLGSWTMGTIVVLVALAVSLWVLIPAGPSAPLTDIAIHEFIALSSAVVIAVALALPRTRLMLIGFATYCLLWLGLAPLAQLARGNYPLAAIPTPAALDGASGICLIGYIVFLACYLVAGRKGRPTAARPLRLSRLDIGIRLLGVATLVSLIVLPTKFGGIATFFTSRQQLDIASGLIQPNGSKEDLAIYTALLSITPLVGLAMYIMLPRSARVMFRHSLTGGISLVVLVAGNIISNNPLTQSRSWFATCVFGLALVAALAHRPRLVPIIAGTFVVATVLLLPVGSVFRYSNPASDHFSLDLRGNLSSSGDYDSYQEIAASVEHVERSGVSSGRQLLGPIFFWVPRSVWSGKPIDTGVILAQEQGYQYTNLSSPLWAEGYINFGIIGVVIFLSAAGYLFARLDSVEQSAFRLLVVPFVAPYSLALLRGSLLTVTGRFVVMLVTPPIVLGLGSLLASMSLRSNSRIGQLG